MLLAFILENHIAYFICFFFSFCNMYIVHIRIDYVTSYEFIHIFFVEFFFYHHHHLRFVHFIKALQTSSIFAASAHGLFPVRIEHILALRSLVSFFLSDRFFFMSSSFWHSIHFFTCVCVCQRVSRACLFPFTFESASSQIFIFTDSNLIYLHFRVHANSFCHR